MRQIVENYLEFDDAVSEVYGIEILVDENLSIEKHEKYIEGCKSIVDRYGLVIGDNKKCRIKLRFKDLVIRDEKTNEFKLRQLRVNAQDVFLIAGIPYVDPSLWWIQRIGFLGYPSRTFYIVTRKFFYEKLEECGAKKKYWDFYWKVYERYKNILCSIILFALEIGLGEILWYKYSKWYIQREFEKARKLWTRDVEKMVVLNKSINWCCE